MNTLQLALRTAAHDRDYYEIDQLIAGGATSADLLHAVLHDIARDGNAKLFEILLCSAPLEYDFSSARAIEKAVSSGEAGFVDGEVVAMHIRGVSWKRLLLDDLIPYAKMVAERQAVMDSARASCYLSGLEVPPDGIAVQQRWVRGEITIDECVEEIKKLYPNRPRKMKS